MYIIICLFSAICKDIMQNQSANQYMTNVMKNRDGLMEGII